MVRYIFEKEKYPRDLGPERMAVVTGEEDGMISLGQQRCALYLYSQYPRSDMAPADALV